MNAGYRTLAQHLGTKPTDDAIEAVAIFDLDAQLSLMRFGLAMTGFSEDKHGNKRRTLQRYRKGIC